MTNIITHTVRVTSKSGSESSVIGDDRTDGYVSPDEVYELPRTKWKWKRKHKIFSMVGKVRDAIVGTFSSNSSCLKLEKSVSAVEMEVPLLEKKVVHDQEHSKRRPRKISAVLAWVIAYAGGVFNKLKQKPMNTRNMNEPNNGRAMNW